MLDGTSIPLSLSLSLLFFSQTRENSDDALLPLVHLPRGESFNSRCPGWVTVAMNSFSTFRHRNMAVRLKLATGAVLIVARFNALAAKNRRQQEEGREEEEEGKKKGRKKQEGRGKIEMEK